MARHCTPASKRAKILEEQESEWVRERNLLSSEGQCLLWEQFCNRVNLFGIERDGSSGSTLSHSGEVIAVRAIIYNLDSVLAAIAEATEADSQVLAKLMCSLINITRVHASSMTGAVPIQSSHSLEIKYVPLEVVIGPKTSNMGIRSSTSVRNRQTGIPNLRCVLLDRAVQRLFGFIFPAALAAHLKRKCSLQTEQPISGAADLVSAVKHVVDSLHGCMQRHQEIVMFVRFCSILDENDQIVSELVSIEDMLPFDCS